MSPRLLIVEDDKSLQQLAATMLESLGCKVEIVEDGAQAVECLEDPKRASRFDALFMDVMMPHLDGFQVLDWMKTQSHLSDLPVIVVTGRDKASDFLTGYQKGACYYLTKPFTVDQVTFALDTIFGTDDEEVAPKGKNVSVIPEDFME
jgi:CheY-like chemotaxis protein